MKLQFGTDDRNKLTGTGIYVKVFQITALVASAYILVASNYPPVMMKKGFMSALFETGVMALPRWEVMLLSLLYRLTLDEHAVFFAMVGAALVFGIVAGKILKAGGKGGRTLRIVCAVCIWADFALRGFSTGFGLAAQIAGSVIRLVCLGLILYDLRADKAAKAAPQEEGSDDK